MSCQAPRKPKNPHLKNTKTCEFIPKLLQNFHFQRSSLWNAGAILFTLTKKKQKNTRILFQVPILINYIIIEQKSKCRSRARSTEQVREDSSKEILPKCWGMSRNPIDSVAGIFTVYSYTEEKANIRKKNHKDSDMKSKVVV